MIPTNGTMISTNTTHGTLGDISVSSEPEWFPNLTKHSFVCMASFLISLSGASVLSCCCTSHVKHTPSSSTQSRVECWGNVPGGTGAAPWHSPVLCWDSGPAVCTDSASMGGPMGCCEPLPWEPPAHCSISITVSAGLRQPGKFRKVILTQSNDVLSSQLPCLKIYSEEGLIAPKWSSLFCLYKHCQAVYLDCFEKLLKTKEKTVVFSEL